jgi:transcriptional regulator with XRE-family HTH domain
MSTMKRKHNLRRMPLDIAKIKQLRERLGLSMETAAIRAGLVGRQHWYKIECGQVRNPQLDTIEAIASALEVKAKDLLK